MSRTILSINNARNNDFDYTLTYGNIIYTNREMQNVSIDDIVGSFAFEEQLSLENALSILYNHNDSYGERNFDKLNNDIYTNLNNIKNSNDFIDLIKIGDKYYVGQDGNHRVFYLINEYNRLKEQFKNDPDKLSEIKKMFEIKCRVTKKLEFESINKICYALNKCLIHDIRISFPMDKEAICQVEYSGNIYLIKSEEEFLNFFKSYYESIEKGSDKYNKITSALSNMGILNLSESIIKHPKSDELNELEKQKQIAKQNNDEVAYNYAQSAIEKIIRETRMEVSPEKWDLMSIQEQIAFVKIKMNEAKILSDYDEFNYWNTNLKNLNTKLVSQSEVTEYYQPSQDSIHASNEVNNDNSEPKNQEIAANQDYNYYFDEIVKVTRRYNPNEQMTEEEKKQLIGEIFYYEGYLIRSLTNGEEFRHIFSRAVTELNENEMQIKLQDVIVADMNEIFNKLYPELKQRQEVRKVVKQESVKNNSNDKLNLSLFIDQLRKELKHIQRIYHNMLSDGMIDDIELANLLQMVKKVIDDGYSLKVLATEPNDLKVISVIINTLEEEQKKMTKLQKGIERMESTIRSF